MCLILTAATVVYAADTPPPATPPTNSIPVRTQAQQPNNADGSPLVPNRAESAIRFTARNYSVQEAAIETQRIFSKAPSQERVSWVIALRSFTTNLQNSIVSQLVNEFNVATDTELKREILITTFHAADARSLDLCETVSTSDRPALAAAAGAILTSYGDLRGVDLLSSALNNATPDERRGVIISLESAIRKFRLGFEWDRAQLSQGMTAVERSAVLAPQWRAWWSGNRTRYVTNQLNHGRAGP